MLDKGLTKNIKKKRRDREIGKHKLNEMGALNIKQKKQNKLGKSERSSHSPVVLKHSCSLEKEMATHSSVLAWRIREMGEPGGLPSMGSHRVGHD